MATISTSGITVGQIIRSEHLLRIIGALDGTYANDIVITGVLNNGANNRATGFSSHAEGQYTLSSGQNSHAEGYYATSSAWGSHAEGIRTRAINEYAHAEGNTTLASGTGSHAEGYYTTASGNYSHAEGDTTYALGQGSHAEGQQTSASADFSHAEGRNTVATGQYQHVQGAYNVSSSNSYAWILGNGTANNNRSNLVYASGSQFQVTGSLMVKDILQLAVRTTTPIGIEGMIIASGSAGSSKVYYYNGTTWNALF